MSLIIDLSSHEITEKTIKLEPKDPDGEIELSLEDAFGGYNYVWINKEEALKIAEFIKSQYLNP